MFEGVNNTSGENQDEPFDYLAEAARLREEREAKEAAEKAEKEAKDKQRREERLARQFARSAVKRQEIEKKAEDLEVSSEKAKEQIQEVKQEARDLKKEAEKLTETSIPADDVEMTVTNGSEYLAELNEGEGATLVFEHESKQLDDSIQKVEETVSLADEVSAQALAIARARDALLGVDPVDISTHAPVGESGPVYDLGVAQDELRDRVQHTWELPQSQSASNEMNAESSPALVDMATTEVAQSSIPQPNLAETFSSVDPSSYDGPYSITNGGIERAPDPTSPVTSSIKSGVAFVGGLFAGRSRLSSLKRSLNITNRKLDSEVSNIKRDVESIQKQSQAPEYAVPKQTETLTPVQAHNTHVVKQEVLPNYVPAPETAGSQAPAIPSWIRQIENDVKNGKIVELKKWQHDVLRVQHPELLKRYEKLDLAAKQEIAHQSKEMLASQFTPIPPKLPQPLSVPGDLPAPVLSAASFMTPQPESVVPNYSYASASPSSTSAAGTLSANGYMTIVIIGGIVFGAALIAAFGF
jgi:hypothetical protein